MIVVLRLVGGGWFGFKSWNEKRIVEKAYLDSVLCELDCPIEEFDMAKMWNDTGGYVGNTIYDERYRSFEKGYYLNEVCVVLCSGYYFSDKYNLNRIGNPKVYLYYEKRMEDSKCNLFLTEDEIRNCLLENLKKYYSDSEIEGENVSRIENGEEKCIYENNTLCIVL